MGWKPVSRGTVKAQLSSELILSHSFCFPSRPCGDMSRSPSEAPGPAVARGAGRVFGAGGGFAACCAGSAWTRALLSSRGRDTLSPGFCVLGVSWSVLPAVCSPLEVSCASSCRGAHPSQPPCPFSWFLF